MPWYSLLLGVWVLYLLASRISAFLTQRQHTRKAREWGCEAPPKQPGLWWDIFGLISLRNQIKAFKESRFMESIESNYDTVSQQEGRIVRTKQGKRFGGKLVISTRDRDNVKAVLATQFNDFALSKVREGNMGEVLGAGIFTTNGSQWAHHRALLRPSFTRSQINDLDIHERRMQTLMQALPTDNNGWTDKLDLQDYFFQYTIDHATEFLFGESANVLAAELSGTSGRGKAFGDNFDYAQNHVAYRFRYGGLYWLSRPAAFRKAVRDCHEYIDGYVQAALNKRLQGKEKDIDTGDKYVFLDELVKQTSDPKELRANCLNILLAGRDTTASLLGYLFALLARHPGIFDKLRSIIIEEFGDDWQYDTKKTIDFASLKSCAYLQHCLNETLRLHSIVPANSRIATKDTTLPTGGGKDGKSPVFVPAKTVVGYFNYGTERDAGYWGDDVREFKPERFEGRKSGFEHTPFSAGSRICIGQQLALTSAGYVTVKLLQRFDKLENMDPCLEIRQLVALTSRSLNGTKVRLHEAKT